MGRGLQSKTTRMNQRRFHRTNGKLLGGQGIGNREKPPANYILDYEGKSYTIIMDEKGLPKEVGMIINGHDNGFVFNGNSIIKDVNLRNILIHMYYSKK